MDHEEIFMILKGYGQDYSWRFVTKWPAASEKYEEQDWCEV